MVRIVCLANSWRPGGRCVAGIDLDTGEWVRPVPKQGNAIPEGATKFGTHDLTPLDVLEVELAPPCLATKYQRENRVVTSKGWKLAGRLALQDVVQYCSSSHLVLHSSGKVADPGELDKLPPEQWSSLELRKVEQISFVADPHKQDRWHVRFHPGGVFSNTLDLSLTDPLATASLKRGERLRGPCLITVSLTEPIAVYGKPELCYKLAACLMPIP